jgi:tetratricopeptide (TPR) repeat protein
VDKSLVTADPHGDAMRYQLPESTRVYAGEKLDEAGERDALASRHLRYFRDWFVELRREYEQLGPGIYAAFATELDDLRVALDGALVRRELVDGAELLAAIGYLWSFVGSGREGVERCEAFLADLPSSEPRLLGELGVSLANILCDTGRFTQACKAGVAAIDYARASGDGSTLVAALYHYAWAQIGVRDFSAAECALSEAEAIEGVSPRCGLHLAECRALLSMEMGDLDSAAHTIARLRKEWRSAESRRSEAMASMQLADIEFRRRQYQRAADLIREAALLARSNDDTSAYLPHFLTSLASVLALSGEVDAAIGPAIEALTLRPCRELESYEVSLAIQLLAYVGAALGDLDRSARLAGYVDASLARIGFSRDYVPLAVYERLMTRLHEHLAPDELARLKTEGASLTPEAAIALARTLETNSGTMAT